MHTRFVYAAIPIHRCGNVTTPRDTLTPQDNIEIRMKLNLKMNIIIKINIKRQ